MPHHRRDHDDDHGGYERAQPSIAHCRYDAVFEILHKEKPFRGTTRFKPRGRARTGTRPRKNRYSTVPYTWPQACPPIAEFS